MKWIKKKTRVHDKPRIETYYAVTFKIKMINSLIFILTWIYGGSLVDLFPYSSTPRLLSILLVAALGGGSGWVLLFTSMDKEN